MRTVKWNNVKDQVHYFNHEYSEYTMAEFCNPETLEGCWYGEPGGMKPYFVAIGPGYVKLCWAVWAWNESEAFSAVEEHCMHDRPDEFNEDGEIEDVYISEIEF
jgi:hypothetical protein